MFGIAQEQKPAGLLLKADSSRRQGRLLDLLEWIQITGFRKPPSVRMSIILHGLEIGAERVHSPTHFPALMQLAILLERVVID